MFYYDNSWYVSGFCKDIKYTKQELQHSSIDFYKICLIEKQCSQQLERNDLFRMTCLAKKKSKLNNLSN